MDNVFNLNVKQAVDDILKRDDDGNLMNEGLNNLEGELFLNLQSQQVNSTVGECCMEQYQEEVEKELEAIFQRAKGTEQ